MHRAMGIHKATDYIKAGALGCTDGNLQIAHVVERIVSRVVANTVGNHTLGGQRHYVVGKQLEGEETLPAVMND